MNLLVGGPGASAMVAILNTRRQLQQSDGGTWIEFIIFVFCMIVVMFVVYKILSPKD